MAQSISQARLPASIWPTGWRWQGSTRQGRWWAGQLRDQQGGLLATARSGVLDFTRGKGFWPLAHLRQLDEQRWLERNWQTEWRHAQRTPQRLALCRAALSRSGPILELAVGPGGGNLAPLLQLDPTRELLVNDLEPRLLQRWSDFLMRESPAHRVSFAAFDSADMPLANCCIASISSVGGLGSIQGDPLRALQECARVLQPDGLLIAGELSLTGETVAALPRELLALWSNSPWLLGRWPQLVRQAGLRLCSDQATAVALGPDDGLWQDAAHFGVRLQAERHYLLLRK